MTGTRRRRSRVGRWACPRWRSMRLWPTRNDKLGTARRGCAVERSRSCLLRPDERSLRRAQRPGQSLPRPHVAGLCAAAVHHGPIVPTELVNLGMSSATNVPSCRNECLAIRIYPLSGRLALKPARRTVTGIGGVLSCILGQVRLPNRGGWSAG